MNDNSIFGCFVKTTADGTLDGGEQALVFEKGKLFRAYIFGEKGINHQIIKTKNIDYGKDLVLILFQFYVYPLQNLEPIDYRMKEKSIGVPIVINDKNFFSKSDDERYKFLKESILEKIDLIAEFVKKKKFDTDTELLKKDLLRLL